MNTNDNSEIWLGTVFGIFQRCNSRFESLSTRIQRSGIFKPLKVKEEISKVQRKEIGNNILTHDKSEIKYDKIVGQEEER
jgi:hypothetical protein